MKKAISILLAMTLIFSGFVFTANAEDNETKVITAAFGDFTDSSRNNALTLQGLSDAVPDPYAQYDVRAKAENGVIKLTPKKWNPGLGTAFLTQKIKSENAEFSTFFSFDQYSVNSDGFSFVVANYGNYAPTSWGYAGMTQNDATLYLAFDTFANSEYGETSDNAVSLHYSVSGGSGWTPMGTADLNDTEKYALSDGSALKIGDGIRKYCWVDYDGAKMYVTLSYTTVRSEGVSVEFDLSGLTIQSHLGDELYYGFTSIIYDSAQYTNIASWYLENSYAPIDISLCNYTDEVASMSMQALATDGETAAVTVFAQDYYGNPAQGVEIALSTDNGVLSAENAVTDANGTVQVTISGENVASAVVSAVTKHGIKATAAVKSSDSVSITAAFNNFNDSALNSLLRLEGLSDANPGVYAQYDVRAKIEDGVIKLTPIRWNPGIGTAFLDKKIVTDGGKFSTFFSFNQYSENTDGFTFVIGNYGSYCPKNWMYAGMNQDNAAMYLAFDTYANAPYGESSNNAVSLRVSEPGGSGWEVIGDIIDLDSSDNYLPNGNILSIGDGQLKYCWIDYDGAKMYVTLSYTAVRSEGVSLEFDLGENTIQKRFDEELYFGFSSIIYDSAQYTNIASWYLENTYAPIDPATSYIIAASQISLAAKATEVETATVEITAYDYAGNYCPNTEITVSSENGRFEPFNVTTGLNGKAVTEINGDLVYMDTVTAVSVNGIKASAAVEHPNVDLTAEFEAKTFTSNIIEDGTLNYRIYVPDAYDGTQEYPVLLFMHGLGERGDDNTSQIAVNNGILKRLVGIEGEDYPCIIIAPQCPAGDTWCNPDNNCVDTAEEGVNVWNNYSLENTPVTNAAAMAYELVQSVIAEYGADADRVYGAGLSMGCFGVMHMAALHPELFAAVIGICGGADPDTGSLFDNTSFWLFSGNADSTVAVENSRAVYQSYSNAGLDVTYTEYDGVGHYSWNNAFNEPKLLKWLFSKDRTKKYGDVNGDNSVNIKDLISLKKAIALNNVDSVVGGDLNLDGKVNSQDLAELRIMLLKM